MFGGLFPNLLLTQHLVASLLLSFALSLLLQLVSSLLFNNPPLFFDSRALGCTLASGLFSSPLFIFVARTPFSYPRVGVRPERWLGTEEDPYSKCRACPARTAP